MRRKLAEFAVLLSRQAAPLNRVFTVAEIVDTMMAEAHFKRQDR